MAEQAQTQMQTQTKKQWLVLFFLVLGSILLGVLPNYLLKKGYGRFHLRNKGAYFYPVKFAEFSHYDIPCLALKIEGKQTTAKFDLGFSGDMSLPEEFLMTLKYRPFIRTIKHFGLRGKTYESNIYEIPEIRIDRMSFYKAKVQGSNLEFENDAIISKEKENDFENLGRIGWKTFYNFNIFIDCENSLMAFCDGLKTLEKQGYPAHSFAKTSLLLDRDFIEFEAMTDLGPLRCVLDTGATCNFLNKDLQRNSNEHMVLNPENADEYRKTNSENKDHMVFNVEYEHEFPVFKIGGQDFGPVNFRKIKIPAEIDAIIGMDFIEDNLIFIDFPQRKIYFYGI